MNLRPRIASTSWLPLRCIGLILALNVIFEGLCHHFHILHQLDDKLNPGTINLADKDLLLEVIYRHHAFLNLRRFWHLLIIRIVCRSGELLDAVSKTKYMAREDIAGEEVQVIATEAKAD